LVDNDNAGDEEPEVEAEPDGDAEAEGEAPGRDGGARFGGGGDDYNQHTHHKYR
jgi:hypothetical protein